MKPDTVVDVIAKQGQRQPAAIALIDDNVELSYGELNRRVTLLTNWFHERKCQRVAVALDNSIDWIVADLALMHAGITAVPIPSFFSAEQVRHVMQTAQIDCVISDSHDPDSTVTEVLPGLSLSAARMLQTPVVEVLPAKITYTSGSTGSPKGVVLGYAAITQVAQGIVSALASIPLTRHLNLLPLATLLENIAGVYAPLMKGITVIVPSPEAVGLSGSSSLDAGAFASCLTRYQPDSIIMVPQLAMALVTLVELDMLNADCLKMAAVGGGKTSTALMAKAAELELPLFEGYGLTEAGSVCTLNLPDMNKPGSVGKALPHVELKLDDTGELLIKGTLMTGYLDETPFGHEWLRTGDLAEIDEAGFVTIKGRIKNTFITAYGRNINPEWVEAELAQQLAVSQALFLGEAQASNLALIWPRFERDPLAMQQLVDELNTRLPDYAQVHNFILLDQAFDNDLLTSNGRIKRQAALDAYQHLIDEHYLTTASSFTQTTSTRTPYVF